MSVMTLLSTALLFFALGQAPLVSPINQVGVATNCDNQTTACTYTDVSVPAGPHFYFAVACNTSQCSPASNRVDVVIPSGTHNVILSWVPSVSPNVTYYIYRGAPATNLQITGSN